MNRIASVEDHKLAALYENVRRVLRSPKYADRREKPLAFWALPRDRRLPMALLGYSLDDLLAHSFEKLSATAGIGKKKARLADQAAAPGDPRPSLGVDTGCR
jgi:hypothetical protein